MTDHRRTSLVLDVLEMAIGRWQPESGLPRRSYPDRQYAPRDYRSSLERCRFHVSMSRKGNCWDNTIVERFFGAL